MSSRAHLVMVVHGPYPIGEPRVEREARAAAEAGYRVTVVCLQEPDTPRRASVDGVEVRRLRLRHRRGAGLARILFEYLGFTGLCALRLARLGRRGEEVVLQLHAPPDFIVLAALVPKLRGCRVVLDIHDLSSHMYAARFDGRRGAAAIVRALAAVERWACRLADRVITVHEPYRQELLRNGVPAAKVSVVMNSVDPKVLPAGHAAPALGNGSSRRANPDRDGTFTVAYHGTLTHWYGVDLLIDAFAQLRDGVPGARMMILGEGDALAGLRERADAHNVAAAIEFSGRYLPIEEALARVGAADCGVIPNLPSRLNRFALSSKLFEYVALGVPAAVARLETLSAHFNDDEVSWFTPGDATSLATSLRSIADDPAGAAQRAARARAAAQKYSWDSQRAGYLELITQLSNGTAPP